MDVNRPRVGCRLIGLVSVSGPAAPTNSLHQLAEFRVGMQAREGGLASQLDEIRVVLPIDSCDVVRRNIAVIPFAELPYDPLHRELVPHDSVRLREPRQSLCTAPGM